MSDLLDGLDIQDKHVWGFDTTLAAFIAAGIERMAKMGHSYPGHLTFDEWQRILAEMVAGFRQYAIATETGEDPDMGAVNKSLDLLREWFPHLWD